MVTVARIVEWLRLGYPGGVPEHDYVPLFALLSRTLTADEVDLVALEVLRQHDGGPITRRQVEDVVVRVTRQPPPPEFELGRVASVLVTAGWPLAGLEPPPEQPIAPAPGEPLDPPTDLVHEQPLDQPLDKPLHQPLDPAGPGAAPPG